MSAERVHTAPAGDESGGTDEVTRRLVHAAGAVAPAAYLLDVVTWGELRALYLAGTALAIALELLRLVAGVDWRIFRRLTREYEATNPAGYALYVVSSTAVVLAFRPRIAVPALLMLALVDPVSGLLARNEFGDPKRPAVLAVTFALAAVIAVPFVPPAAAVFGALAVTVADGMTPVISGYVIDDNASIPIAAAAAMWVGLRLPPVS